MIRAAAVALIAVSLGSLAPSLVAQTAPQPGGKCIITFEGSVAGRTTRTNLEHLPSGKYNAYIGGGFVGHCEGQNMTLISDSAEYYGDQSLMYLIDHVHYIEPRAKVDADHMTYWMAEEHLRAEGNVYAVLASGTTMRGPVADYYRAVPPIRTQAMLVATGRPHMDLVQVDSITHQPADTIDVLADHLTSVADSLIYAGGDVHITRPDLLATGDSAFVDQGTGRARLMRKPSVEARHDRPFTLTGGVIDVFSSNRLVNRVVATPNGHATSQDLQLFADSVDLRVQNNELQRAMAWGKTRAHAISPDRDIVADSIDAILPNQRISQIRATGDALATSIPDTATITTKERDWIRGDTVVATFDTLTRADSSRNPPVKRIVARHTAKAFYHLKNSKNDKTRPGINYVTGRVIDIAFMNGGVDTVTVHDKASGVYLEAADTTQPAKPKTPRRVPTPRIPTIRHGDL